MLIGSCTAWLPKMVLKKYLTGFSDKYLVPMCSKKMLPDTKILKVLAINFVFLGFVIQDGLDGPAFKQYFVSWFSPAAPAQ